MDVQNIIAKVKELISKGNVSRIVVRRRERELLNIPVNVGVVGTVAGLAYAKWLMLAGVLATIGFGCTVEVIKADGDVVNVMDEAANQKVRDFASDTVEKVKESIPVTISVDIKKDSVSDVIDADVTDASDENNAN